MASDAFMIEAEGLTKRFGTFVAVTDVTFGIKAGEVVAFLGPNGAGKSTTMKMLTGFLAPTAGRARVCGIDVAQDRIAASARIGYLPENGPLYTDMSPVSLLRFFGQTRGMPGKALREAIDHVMGTCALRDVANKRISKLSRGYRQRVGLAHALLHGPDVLILDEPTSGLDPNQIQEIRGTLRTIGEEKTILLSTHLLQEVEAMATRVMVIHAGRLVFDGKPQELEKRGAAGGMEAAFRKLTEAA